MLSISKIFFSLLCIAHVSCALNFPNKHKTMKMTMEPLNLAEASEETIQEIRNELKKQAEAPEKTEEFSEKEIDEMEMVFESSPKKAQYIVKQLEDPANSKVNYRSAYFVGEPGTGKTMMAKAIAYKMAQKGWTCKRLSSCELIGKYRHETGMRLENLLETAAASDKPTLIIIDDLNLLLEHTGSKYHDTAETAAILWDFLNRENNNEKLFFIGTMYRANKLPEYYKNRMMSNGIYFPLITNPKFINKLIRKTLTTQHTHLDKAVTDSFLNETLAKIGPCSARALTLMSENIFFMLEENDEKKSIPITKAHIERAIKEYMLVKKTMDS